MTEKIVGEPNSQRKQELDLLQLELDKDSLSPDIYGELKRLFSLPPVSPEIQAEDDHLVSLLIDIVSDKLNRDSQ